MDISFFLLIATELIQDCHSNNQKPVIYVDPAPAYSETIAFASEFSKTNHDKSLYFIIKVNGSSKNQLLSYIDSFFLKNPPKGINVYNNYAV